MTFTRSLVRNYVNQCHAGRPNVSNSAGVDQCQSRRMNHRSEIDAINRSFSDGQVAGNCAPRYAGDMQMGKAVQEEWRAKYRK